MLQIQGLTEYPICYSIQLDKNVKQYQKSDEITRISEA